MTVIEWVNHASFIVRSNGTSLLCDPWLYGSAFNDGWELLVPSEHGVGDIADVDALWFSHVHPDHFAPLVVRLTDLDRVARFSPSYGLAEVDRSTPADVELSSQSLAYTLKFDWGADTLSVNGRFRATALGFRRMLRTFGPSVLNNNGRPLAFRLLLDPWLVRRAIDRVILRGTTGRPGRWPAPGGRRAPPGRSCRHPPPRTAAPPSGTHAPRGERGDDGGGEIGPADQVGD